VKTAIIVLKIYELVLLFVEMASRQKEKTVKTVLQTFLAVEYVETVKKNPMKIVKHVPKIIEHAVFLHVGMEL
jgi:hypothetical protein